MEDFGEVQVRVFSLEPRLTFFPQCFHQGFGILAEVDLIMALSAQPHHQTVLLAFRSVSTTEDVMSIGGGLSANITTMYHLCRTSLS